MIRTIAAIKSSAIIWKPVSSDRSDHSDSTIPGYTALPTAKYRNSLFWKISQTRNLWEFMSSLSFSSLFTLKCTYEYKKPTFKQESTIHSRHVEFDEWCEQCVRRRSPRPSFTFSAIVAIAAIIWKP